MGVLPVHGAAILRNVLLTVGGQAVPLACAVIALPYLLAGLGAERFGLLALVWTVLGYFTVLDFGLGRALIYAAAGPENRRDARHMSDTAWTAANAQAALGTLGAILLLLIGPSAIDAVPLPRENRAEVEEIVLLVAVALPVVLLSGSFRGLVEAKHRFLAVNAIAMPLGVANFLLPTYGVAAGWNLAEIVRSLVAVRGVALALYVGRSLQLYPGLARWTLGNRSVLIELVEFGRWVMLSNAVAPILLYSDRLLIAGMLTLADVALYTIPQELVLRGFVLPASVVLVLFPAFAAMRDMPARTWLRRMFTRSTRLMLSAVGSGVTAVVFASRDLLSWWLGALVASDVHVILVILAAGAFLQAVAQIPLALLQSVNRPSAVAKLQLALVVPYVLATYWLIDSYGLIGAACSWVARASTQLVAYLLLAARAVEMRFETLVRQLSGPTLGAALGIGGAAFLVPATQNFPIGGKVAVLVALISVVVALGLVSLRVDADEP